MEYFCLLFWQLFFSISRILPLQLGQSEFSQANLNIPNHYLVYGLSSIKLAQRDSTGDSTCVHSCAFDQKVHSKEISTVLAEVVEGHQTSRLTPRQKVLTNFPSAHWKNCMKVIIYFMIRLLLCYDKMFYSPKSKVKLVQHVYLSHSFKVWVHRIYRVGLLTQTHAQSDLQSWVKLCEYDIQGREGRYLSIVYSSEKLSRYDLILISRKVSWKVARIVLFVFRIVQTDVRLLGGGNEKESITTSVILLEEATSAPDGEGGTEWELLLVSWRVGEHFRRSFFAPSSCRFWSV